MNPSTTLVSPWADSELAGAHGPQPRWIRLPAIDGGLSHRLTWARAALAGLLRRHRLNAACTSRYCADVDAGAGLAQAFAELFDLRHGPGGAHYPLLHAHGAIVLLQQRLLADLGLNLARVRHLRHRTRLPHGLAQPCGEQQIDARVQRVTRVSPTEVAVLMQTTVSDGSGRPWAQVEDTFAVFGLEVAYAVQAEEDDLLRRAVSRMRRREAELNPHAADMRVRQLYIAPAAGRRYARLSGEQQPAHLGALAARLVGRKRAFAQPMYLRHLITRELAEWQCELASLTITFVGKAYLGHAVRLVNRGAEFELIDARGRLIAFGRC